MKTTLTITNNKGVFTAFMQANIPAGTMQFNLRDGKIMVITHTIVEPAFEGQGVGKALVLAGIEYAQENNYQILPLCSFARIYIERKPELHHLLYTE